MYITKEIERLHKMREEMLNKPKNEERKFEKIDFKSLGFDEKKLVASQFINRILIGEKRSKYRMENVSPSFLMGGLCFLDIFKLFIEF
ncbi:MAG: hypothetical protein L6V93_05150 [Clostridiales bacterium]|nr:MAG: hypothetical protein L6V93_05150 [Clostridiales bacterium]